MFAPARVSRVNPPTPIIAVATVLVVLATWFVLRLEGKTLADLGISFDLTRLAQLAVGLGLGAAGFAALAWALMLAGMIHWQPNQSVDDTLIRGMLLYFATAALIEELIFRGFALRRLAESIGDVRAVIVMSIIFGTYHIVNIGASMSVQSGGWDLLWRVLGPAAGGLVFGFAATRTRGIALPFGLHFAGNVVQWVFLTLRTNVPSPLTPVLGPFAQPAFFQLGYIYLMFALLVAVLLSSRAWVRESESSRSHVLTA